jgi:hypothetical protein
MGATLRVVLKSTLAPWVALVASAICSVLLLALMEPSWFGEYFWSAMTVETDLYPAVIATALAIGIDCVRVLQPRRQNLLVVREFRPTFLRYYMVSMVVGLAVPMVLAYLGTMTTWNAYLGRQQAWASIHVLVVVLSVAAILMAALLVGWMSSTAAVVLAPLVGLWLALVAMNQTGLVTIGSTTGSMLGFGPAWGSVIAQVIAALVVIVVGYLILIARERPGVKLPWTSILTIAIVVVLGASGGLQLAPYQPTSVAESACYGNGNNGGSRTCMSVQHERLLDPLDQQYLAFEHAAKDVGVPDAIPRTVVEDYTEFESPSKQADLRIGPEVAAWRASEDELSNPNPMVTQESFAEAITDPSHCPQMSAEDPPADAVFALMDKAKAEALTMVDEDASKADRHAAAVTLKKDRQTLMSCDF